MATQLPQRDFESLLLGSRLFCRNHGGLYRVLAVAGQRLQLSCGCRRPVSSGFDSRHRFMSPIGTRRQLEGDDASLQIIGDAMFFDGPKTKKRKRART